MIKIIITVILSVAIGALIIRSNRLESSKRDLTQEALLDLKHAAELSITSSKSTNALLSLIYITRATQIVNSVGDKAGIDTLNVRKNLRTKQERVLNSIYKHYPNLEPKSAFTDLLL